MFLSKRNGIYYIFYDQTSGKRTCVSTKTKVKKEAIHFLVNFEQNIKGKDVKAREYISLSTLQTEYLKYSATRHSSKTTKDYGSVIRDFINFIGKCSINKIEKNSIEKYVQHKFQKSMFVASKNLRYLKSIFNWAVTQEYIDSSPCQKVKNIRLPEKQPLFLSKNDFNILLEKIDDQLLKQIVIFAIYTGLRESEILTLKWDQVDIKNKMIILSNRSHITKSRRVRSVPLNDSAFHVINNRIGISEELVFTKSGRPILNNYVTKKFKFYIRQTSFNQKLKFHSLRHTFASWLVQNGVSIYEVSKLLGHADIKTTEIYAHLSPENFRNAVELLN